jgi:hypothetical protein
MGGAWLGVAVHVVILLATGASGSYIFDEIGFDCCFRLVTIESERHLGLWQGVAGWRPRSLQLARAVQYGGWSCQGQCSFHILAEFWPHSCVLWYSLVVSRASRWGLRPVLLHSARVS